MSWVAAAGDTPADPLFTEVRSVRWSRKQVLLGAMPFLLIGVVAVVVVAVRRAVDALPLLSLGPAFATVAGELLYLLVTGGAAVMLCVVVAVYRHLAASMPAVLTIAAIVGVTAAGVLVSAGVRRRKRETAQLAAIAEVTQRVLLRPVPETVGSVRIAVRYVSASRGARIGGDLYETASTHAGLRCVIGDVQGRGLPAVLTAAIVLGAFRESVHDAPDLPQIADRIERSLARQANGERFVTAVLAQVSDDGSKVDLLNYGHPPPLLLSGASAGFVEPQRLALPFGLTSFGGAPAELVSVAFGPGDRMLFYTDGISEARSASGDFFPLASSLAEVRTAEPNEALARLSDDVRRHVGHPLDDDAALLLICR